MVVSVTLFGLQRQLAKTDQIQIPLSNKTNRVADLLNRIREKYPEMSLDQDMVLITVNNHASSLDERLKDNDEVSFIPYIGGG